MVMRNSGFDVFKNTWYDRFRVVFVLVVVLSPIPPFAFFPIGTSDAFLPTSKRVQVHDSGSSLIEGGGKRWHWTAERHQYRLAAKSNKWDKKKLDEFCASQESRAVSASDSWIVEATNFLEPEASMALLQTLVGRSDVSCLNVGSYRDSEDTRVRCVFANPDLGYDKATAESDYVSYLKIDNVMLSECKPWPNILVNIGLVLEQVGDVFLVSSNPSKVYLAVVPEAEKTCIRLLPKELPGTGVTVTKLSREEMDNEMESIADSDGDIVEDMEVQRVDKRK